MGITVFLGGFDATHKLKNNSLRIRKSLTTKNTLDAVFIDYNIQAGQEIVVKQGAATLFGGLVQSITREFITPSKTQTQITAAGYEQVCSRRTFGGAFTNKYAGEIIRNILNNWMSISSPFSEGFSEGEIQNGIFLKNYVVRAKNFKDILDDLAEASGFKWWVDDDKKLYFKEDIDILDSGFVISDTPHMGRLLDVRDLKIEESLAGYRNKQFVLGAVSDTGFVLATSENEPEINRMKTLYGSGVYGNVLINNNLASDIEAKIVADSLLSTYSRLPKKAAFSTAQGFNTGQTIQVKVSSLNIHNFTKFLISDIEITQRDKEILYYCECDFYDDAPYNKAKVKDDWTDGFATFSSKNKENPNAVYFATDIVLQWLKLEYTLSKITVEFDVPFTEPPAVSLFFVYDKKGGNDGSRAVVKRDFHYAIDYIIQEEQGGNLKYTGVAIEAGGVSPPASIDEGYFTLYAIGRFK